MSKSLQKIIEAANSKANDVISRTADIRRAFLAGRPNSSEESTTAGTLEACEALVAGFTPDGYTVAE